MKKIYSIILTAVVCLAGFAACTNDYPVGPMARNISLSPAALQAPAAGQSVDVTLSADGAWVADTPDWISVSPARGEGGETVKVTVAANDGAERTDKVKFYSAVGDVSKTDITLDSTPLAELTVTQAAGEGQGQGGGDDKVITVADYIAIGENTDSYIITGVVTRVANTNYGNFDLTDGTGTIYVYGLLNENLEAQKCWKEKELAMGDIITVQSNNLQFYNGTTWEIVNAVYVSHEKALIDVDKELVEVGKAGEDFTVVATVKGEDVKVDYDADWITFKGATKNGEEVTLNFTADANAGVPRSVVMTASTTTAKGETSAKEVTVKQEGAILTVSVADFISAEESDVVLYDLIGTISKISNATYGNFDLTDATGTIYVYGLTATDLGYGASNDKSFASLGLKEGDLIKIRGYRSSHNGNPQVKSAWFLEKLADGPKPVTVAEFLASEESETQVYVLEGTIGGTINTTYGNFDLTDASGTIYVYGLTATDLGYGAKNDKSYGSLGLKEGDKIKIKGYRSSHNGNPQVKSAWFVELVEKAPETPETPGEPAVDDNAVTMTDASLPTAYPTEEATVTEGSYDFYIFNVANYGNGMQFKKSVGYVANKTAMPSDIKSIVLSASATKDYYAGNLKVYAGSAEKPEGTALTGTLDEGGKVETFAVPAGCKYFRIVNESGYAAYVSSIKVML